MAKGLSAAAPPPADSHAGAQLLVRVELPFSGRGCQLQFTLGPALDESAFDGVRELVSGICGRWPGASSPEEAHRAEEQLRSLRGEAGAEVEAWQAKVKMAEEWRRKVDKAASTMNKMREDYFKELMHLREQVYRQGKAREAGEHFHPDYAAHFNPGEYCVDDEVQRLVSQKEAMLEQEYDARLGEVEVGYMSRIRDLKDQVFSARFLQRRNHELVQVLKDRFGLDSAALRDMLESTKVNEEKLKAQIEKQAAEAERRAVEAFRDSVAKQQRLEQQIAEQRLEQQLAEQRLQQRQERRASAGTVDLGADEGLRVRRGGLRRRSQGPDGHVIHALEAAARAPRGAGDCWRDLREEDSDGFGDEAEPSGGDLRVQARTLEPRRHPQAQVNAGTVTDLSIPPDSEDPLVAKETAEVGTDPQAFYDAFGAPLLKTRGVQSEVDGRMLSKALGSLAECDCAGTVAQRTRRSARCSLGEKSLAEATTDCSADGDADAATDDGDGDAAAATSPTETSLGLGPSRAEHAWDTNERLAGRTSGPHDQATFSTEGGDIVAGGSFDATPTQHAFGGVTGARGPAKGPRPASGGLAEAQAPLQELQEALSDMGSAQIAAARNLTLTDPPGAGAEGLAEMSQETAGALLRRCPSPHLGSARMRWLSELACPELRCLLASAWERAEKIAAEVAPSDSLAMRLLPAWLQEGPYPAPPSSADAPRGQADDGHADQSPKSSVRGVYFNSLMDPGRRISLVDENDESSGPRASAGPEAGTVQCRTRQQTMSQSSTTAALTARGRKLRHTMPNPEQAKLLADSRQPSNASTARGDPQGAKELLQGLPGTAVATPNAAASSRLFGMPNAAVATPDAEPSTEPAAATLMTARGRKLRHTLPNPEQPKLLADSCQPSSNASSPRADPHGAKERLSGLPGVAVATPNGAASPRLLGLPRAAVATPDAESSIEPATATLVSSRGRMLRHTLHNPEQAKLLAESRQPSNASTARGDPQGAKELLSGLGGIVVATPDSPRLFGLPRTPDAAPSPRHHPPPPSPSALVGRLPAMGSPRAGKGAALAPSGDGGGGAAPPDDSPGEQHPAPAPAGALPPALLAPRRGQAPGETAEPRTGQRATRQPAGTDTETPLAKPRRRASTITIILPTGAPKPAESPRSEASSESGLGQLDADEEPRLAPGWSGVVPPASFSPRRNQEAAEPGPAQAAAPPQDSAASPAAARPRGMQRRRASTIHLVLPSIVSRADSAEAQRAPTSEGAGGDRTDDDEGGGQTLADDAAAARTAARQGCSDLSPTSPARPSGKSKAGSATWKLLQLPDHTGMQLTVGSKEPSGLRSPCGASGGRRSPRPGAQAAASQAEAARHQRASQDSPSPDSLVAATASLAEAARHQRVSQGSPSPDSLVVVAASLVETARHPKASPDAPLAAADEAAAEADSPATASR